MTHPTMYTLRRTRVGLLLLLLLAPLALFLAACDSNGDDDDPNPDPNPNPSGTEVIVTDDIESDATWSSDSTWVLDGLIFVNPRRDADHRAGHRR